MAPIAAREQIAKLLGESGRGSFAARRTAAADDLVLAVEGVGPIRFPITPAQAKRLAGTSRPARYGRREQTLLDRTIRDTGEIPARRIKIDQRQWNRTLRLILAALGTDLGLAPGQRLAATLHGMLVYGPGQFFKQHQDSERAEGMVGTLVVTLPSSFTGGAIVVEHQDEVVAYRATKQPLAFIAFYADCRHEIRRVTAGYRIVLTYDLILKGEATGNDAPARSIVDSLASLLRGHFTTPLPPSRWGREDAAPREPPNRLVYLLDHQYTERGLGWLRLKGSDAARAAALRAAAESAGCEIALSLAEIQETWGCMEEGWNDFRFASHLSWERDEDEWSTGDEPPPDGPDAYELVDLQDSSITLQHWIDTRGRKAEAITTVSDEEVCATTPTSSLAPHAAEYEGFMGNYGNTMDRWYRRAALVLWPRERAFAVRAEASPGWALETIAKRLNMGELAESRAMAKSLLAFWDRVADPGDRRGLFAKVLRVAVGVEAPQLAEALLQPFAREALTPAVARELAALVALYGEAWFRQLLGAWSRSQPAGVGRRELLTWLASLPSFCRAATQARDDPAGTTAARLLLEEGWRALRQEIESRQRLEAASQRERALVELANPILGWLGGAAVVERSRPGEASMVAAVSYLCAGDNAALVPCLLKMLRASVRTMKPEARGMLGLDAIAKHCAEWLAAQLESPPRADDDWSIVPPATCRCALCRKLGAFLANRTLCRLEWPLAKQGRRHVHTVIDSQELPVRHETRRSGSPFTLVLEKSNTLFAQETAVRRAWQAELDWLAGAGWTTALIGASRRRTKTRSASSKRARPSRSH